MSWIKNGFFESDYFQSTVDVAAVQILLTLAFAKTATIQNAQK
jgi:hypothetical protein